MPKKCIICNNEAEYCVKNASECYCKECAEEHFNDISYLQNLEEEASKLKKFVDEKMK